MRTVRQMMKKLIRGASLRRTGYFPYFGEKVYAPAESHLFDRVCQEGIYEQRNVQIIQSLVENDSYYFDIGANIGLMSIPFLKLNDKLRVVSVEASSGTIAHLQKTWDQSSFQERWTLYQGAVGSKSGKVQFFEADGENAAFSGLRDTGRGGAMKSLTVEMSTIDDVWHSVGRPPVRFMKIDVEGAEIEVLRGAGGMLGKEKPALLIEINKTNMSSYGYTPEVMFKEVDEIGYNMYASLNMDEINSSFLLRVAMTKTEDFYLFPKR